jgi:hypothetical protein
VSDERTDGHEDEGLAFGRGFTAAHREDRAELEPGVACLATSWIPYPSQRRMLGVAQGIVLASGALGSGKSEP